MVTTVRKSLIEPLSSKVPIVDEKGNPTAYFQRLLQRIQAGSSLSVGLDGTIDVAEGEITLEMLQEIQFKTVLGLNDVVNGPVEEVTATQILDWLGTAARGDILYRGASTWSFLHAGTTGQVLKTNGAGADPSWLTPATGGTDYLVIKNFDGLPNAADTINVNSTSYVDIGSLAFAVDLDRFLFTDFRLVFSASSNAAAQTVTAQLTAIFAPTTPIHTGGNDIVITNSFGVFDSGWRTRDAGGSSGLVNYGVALKGSNATVDLAINSMTVMLKK